MLIRLLINEKIVVNEYNGDTLMEVPSPHFHLRKYIANHFPKHDLMHCKFTDLDNDGIEDVIFFLHSLDYDNKANLTPIVGIAFGDGNNSFRDLTTSKSIIKKGVQGVDFSIEENKITLLAFYYSSNSDESESSAKVEKYIFTIELNDKKVYWFSKTTFQDLNTEKNYYYEDSQWQEEETQHFKTNKILFENAW